MKKSILIVSDDTQIVDVLTIHMEAEGYGVFATSNSKEAVSEYEKKLHDLLVIDMGLKDCDGVELSQTIRSIKDTKVVFLTEENKQQGLSIDIVKNTANEIDVDNIDDLLELVAEQFELHKRQVTQKLNVGTYECDDLKVDINQKRVWIKDTEVRLSEIMINLLIFMILNEDNYISKKELYQQVWNNPVSQNDSTVMAHIRNLRRLIKDEKVSSPRYIHTKRGVGYMFSCSSSKR